MSVKHQAWLATPTVVFALMTVGCTASYRPGLGELMNFTQMRHAKLWFAGQEQNWQLAQYEVDDCRRGLMRWCDSTRLTRTHRFHCPY